MLYIFVYRDVCIAGDSVLRYRGLREMADKSQYPPEAKSALYCHVLIDVSLTLHNVMSLLACRSNGLLLKVHWNSLITFSIFILFLSPVIFWALGPLFFPFRNFFRVQNCLEKERKKTHEVNFSEFFSWNSIFIYLLTMSVTFHFLSYFSSSWIQNFSFSQYISITSLR